MSGPAVEQLVRDHVGLAFVLAEGFYLPGGDRDDVQQEALIGLYLAARAYVPGETPFRGFAALVIRRRLGTALKLALRQKHRPLNSAARPITVDGDVLDPADGAYHPASIDTLQRVIDRENVAELRQRIPSLTELERVAVAGYVNGVPYTAGYVRDKSVDNALVRARRKLAA